MSDDLSLKWAFKMEWCLKNNFFPGDPAVWDKAEEAYMCHQKKLQENNMNSNFRNAKVGDRVFGVEGGWGYVSAIHSEGPYVVDISCDGGEEDSYTIDGKFSEDNIAPSAWLEADVPQYYLDLFPKPKITSPCSLKVYAVIWREDGEGEYRQAIFSNFRVAEASYEDLKKRGYDVVDDVVIVNMPFTHTK